MSSVRRLGWIMLGIAWWVASPAASQNVVLDRQVRAGDLVLFPSVRDDKVFYYAPSQPKLARQNGKPQFSFLRYVENVAGSDGEDAAREGQGGGIVHALVTLAVTETQLERARQELERQIKGARIEGPVAYSSGTFGLVSSFADEEGEFARNVVGLGKAPLLDGSKAAVSIHLTKLGAKVLWESFQTPQPDISFQFEMELEGYRSPKQAIIEADFDRIYAHESFDLGLAGNVGVGNKRMLIGAEISQAMEDLYESKAIKVTQIGEDEQLDQLVQMAFGKLVDMMFQPPNEGLAGLRPQQQDSILDRATDALNDERERVRDSNDERRARNEERRQAHGQAVGLEEDAELADEELEELETEARRLEAEADAAEARLRRLQAAPTRTETPPSTPSPETQRPAAQPESAVPAPEASPSPAPEATQATEGEGTPRAETASGTQPRSTEAESPSAEPGEEAAPTSSPAGSPSEAPSLSPDEKRAAVAQATEEARTKRRAANTARERVNTARQARRRARQSSALMAGDRERPEYEEMEAPPSLSLMLSRTMKETRHKGVFRIDLNKYTQDTQSYPFAENIGDLRAYFEDEDFFRQVNLDDPFFRQREIAVFVDGLNAGDFGDFVNFVSVVLRKSHDGGQQTLEEVRIDRANFNEEGNDFRMLYGWKDDASRESWMSYEYKPTWSFFGGRQVDGEWTPTSAGAISLSPPYQPRKVTLDADPDLMKDLKVRAITVKLYYDLAGEEVSKETTLNAMRGEFSRNVSFMLPRDVEAYDYEIVWRLRGNKLVKSGRQQAVGSILFVDELPET